MRIGVVDIEQAYVYWCETPGQALDVKKMLNMMGKDWKEVTTH